MRFGPLLILLGCNGGGPAQFTAIDDVYLDGQTVTIDLSEHITETKRDVTFTVSDDPDLIEAIDGSVLSITPQPDWRAETQLTLSLEDSKGDTDETTVNVFGGAEPTNTTAPEGACLTHLVYRPQGAIDGVAAAGDWNDWDPAADPFTDNGDGTWTLAIDIPEGNYRYKLVETPGGAFGGDALWFCDPEQDTIQCDKGYKEPWETDWAHDCTPGADSCNSLLIVPACGPPELEVTSLSIDRDANSVSAIVEVELGGGGAIADATATHNGAPIADAWTGERFEVDLGSLGDGRQTLRFEVTDVSGNVSDEAYVPFWTDERDWESGVMYFAFVDRLKNGDTSIDTSEGATANTGGYEGGDLQGLTEMLPYLDDLGVTVLWLSNIQDNTEGAWDGDCGQTYAGYHAYWPDDPFAVEEHFGDEQALHDLIDGAHARGMRVIMDWVANHVHETHPYYADHPEWFNPYEDCKAYVDSQINFDRIPETCWFSGYLPDIDYSHPDALQVMVDDAMWWAKTYELDGFRADAVKHMSHGVTHNLGSAIRAEIEHVEAGGDEDFYVVGETFDTSYDRINEYVGPNQLDGQFDFPLYFALRDAFIYGNSGVGAALSSMDTSLGAYNGALMSTFLGNHDVLRFVTDANEGYVDPCQGGNIVNAGTPTDPWPTDRLNLAWTFLFTNPNIPLVYYGDEIGLPGHPDPDNRQPLWWHTGGNLDGVDSVAAMASRVSSNGAGVVQHVAALANARAQHSATYRGNRVQWWDEWDLHAYTRSDGGDHMIVVLNRGETARQLTNGLSFAGLPTDGTYRDALTGQTFVALGDSITLDVPARGSLVLFYE